MTVRIARLLPTHEGEPGPADLHDGADKAQILDYMKAATAILFTTATAPDRYAPDAGRPVPLSVRSDGDWVWSDAITYYLEHYDIAPEQDLLDHMTRQHYRCAVLDAAGARIALADFQRIRGLSA
jgi:hypothetical protein